MTSFLDSRKQRVLLNGQCSSWGFINAGVPQGSILGPLLFLIYINNLIENLQSNPKLFADNTSLFTLINDSNATAKQLCEDLDKIKEWAFQWKMSFNPDPSKQAQEVIFTRKVKKVVHPPILFYNKPVQQVSSQKHLGLIFDTSLTFDEHIKEVTSKVSKTIGLLRILDNRLPRSSLTTIYKSFVRPHLNYGDVIFDKAYNNSFQQRLESLQCKVLLAITGAIKGSSTERLYQELGLEPLQNRR